MVDFPEVRHSSSMIHPGGEDNKKIVKQEGLVVEVELKCFVVKLDICNLGDDVFKLCFLPGYSWMCDHRENGVVVFFIFLVKEN